MDNNSPLQETLSLAIICMALMSLLIVFSVFLDVFGIIPREDNVLLNFLSFDWLGGLL